MATTRPPHTSDRARRLLLAGFLVLTAAVVITRILMMGATAQALVAATSTPAAAPAATESASSAPLTPEEQAQAKAELTPGKAIVLGIVEGVTEFLPISSTRHLLAAERIMDIGQTPATKSAPTPTIAIQIGAIRAVVVLYFGRLRRMAEGAVGKDPGGRKSRGHRHRCCPRPSSGSSGASSSRTTCSRSGRWSRHGSSARS
jgi:undecaprenyl-diphosphatase